MAFRSLQLRIVVVFVGLLAVVAALILVLVARSNERIVAAAMARELSAGSRVFARLIEQNQRQLETAATVLSGDFAFRAAIATQDRPTIASVLRNHGSRIGAQVMMVVDPGGQLLVDTQRGGPPRPFPFPALLSAAESAGRSTDFQAMHDGHLYQIVLVPIHAPQLTAWVAMGFLVEEHWVRELAEMTGLEVSVVRHEGATFRVLASSLARTRREVLAAALAQARGRGMAPTLTLAGERFQSARMPLGQGASVVLQRSLEQAEAPYRSMQAALTSTVLAGMVLFLLGSIMFARRIAGPVNQLAAAARRIESGDYAQAVPTLPPDEIGQLAASFAHMRDGIAAREGRIFKLAYEDSLTGLPNRTRFLELFEQRRKDAPAAILVLDLDRFALINNALGHPIGDRILAEVGGRLARVVPTPARVARLWGDEFAFLLEGADRAGAAALAASLLAALRDPILLDGQRLDVDGCLGIALYPGDGADVTTLLRRAELAMYAAKRKHGGYVFAAEVDGGPAHAQLSLMGELRDALARQEFELHYQPKLDLASGRIAGAEALLRWRHPQRGLVPPQDFIPFAEQTGFIREITPWLVGQVAAQAARWRADGLDLVLSLNLSALDLLEPGLVEHTRRMLAQHALPAAALCLEITESALMEDPTLALAHLEQLAQLGVKLSIDDYGTGQASLAYLKTLPVHELKIDRAFIASITSADKDAAIVRSTILLSHALGLTVVAEGAESAEGIAWLRAQGCDLVQGYGIARPMTGPDLPVWIAARAEVAPA